MSHNKTQIYNYSNETKTTCSDFHAETEDIDLPLRMANFWPRTADGPYGKKELESAKRTTLHRTSGPDHWSGDRLSLDPGKWVIYYSTGANRFSIKWSKKLTDGRKSNWLFALVLLPAQWRLLPSRFLPRPALAPSSGWLSGTISCKMTHVKY